MEAEHDIVLRPAGDMVVHRPDNLRVALSASLSLLRDRLQSLLIGTWSVPRRDLCSHPQGTVGLDDR